MTVSYFHKKIILIVALASFLIVGFFPFNISDAQQLYTMPTTASNPNSTTIVGGGSNQVVTTDPTTGMTTIKDSKGNVLSSYKANLPSSKNGDIWCLSALPPFVSLTGCAAYVSFTILQVASWVLWVAAILFNKTLGYTLNMAGFIKDIPIVAVGWTTFRDVTNLMFVFIILYIAINTIIGNEGYGIKKLLGKVIVGAMLINFSLFFTQVAIDASNIFALQFYNKITVSAQGQNIASGKEGSNTDWDAGISAAFVNAMGLQQIYFWGKGAQSSGTGEGADLNDVNGSTKLGLNPGNMILVGLGGTVLVLITAFVFFAATFMFFIRTITLMFLMILSPVAFMGSILPSLGKYTGDWWSKLTNNLLFAPAYMMLLYLVMNMLTSGAFKGVGGKGGNFADMFAGGTSWTGAVMTFIVLITLMFGCLIIAVKLGASGAKWAEKFASEGVGKWTGSLLARNTIGRGADALVKSEFGRTYLPSKALRGINSLADKKFGGRISFIDRKKEKTTLDVKALELRSEVGVRRAGETEAEFSARKAAGRKLAASKLGLTYDGKNFINDTSLGNDPLTGKPIDNKQKVGQIFGNNRLALKQAAWVKKSGKSAKDNLDEQIDSIKKQIEMYTPEEVEAAETAHKTLKGDKNTPGSVAEAHSQMEEARNNGNHQAAVSAESIYRTRMSELNRAQSVVSKSTELQGKLASALSRKAEFDDK